MDSNARKWVYDVAFVGRRAGRDLRTTSNTTVQASSDEQARSAAVRVAEASGWLDVTPYAVVRRRPVSQPHAKKLLKG